LNLDSAGTTGVRVPSANTITFHTAGTEDVRIDANGNVGIGTSSPTQKLDVSGEAQLSYAGGNNYLYFQATNNYVGRNGSTGDMWLNAVGAQNIIYGIGGTERMRLDANGNLGIGVSPSYKFSVTSAGATSVAVLTNSNGSTPYGMSIGYSGAAPANTDYGFLYCSDITNQKLVIYSSGTVSNRTGTYNSLSDIKIKQDISDASSQWDDIKAIKFRKYRLIDDVKANTNAPYFLGVVAQELELTSPNLVDEAPDTVRNEDGTIEHLGTSTKQVKYSILYMKSVKALQEAMTRIETLETKTDTQAETITALTARIAALESK
jgi:hypothetical protein